MGNGICTCYKNVTVVESIELKKEKKCNKQIEKDKEKIGVLNILQSQGSFHSDYSDEGESFGDIIIQDLLKDEKKEPLFQIVPHNRFLCKLYSESIDEYTLISPKGDFMTIDGEWVIYAIKSELLNRIMNNDKIITESDVDNGLYHAALYQNNPKFERFINISKEIGIYNIIPKFFRHIKFNRDGGCVFFSFCGIGLSTFITKKRKKNYSVYVPVFPVLLLQVSFLCDNLKRCGYSASITNKTLFISTTGEIKLFDPDIKKGEKDYYEEMIHLIKFLLGSDLPKPYKRLIKSLKNKKGSFVSIIRKEMKEVNHKNHFSHIKKVFSYKITQYLKEAIIMNHGKIKPGYE